MQAPTHMSDPEAYCLVEHKGIPELSLVMLPSVISLMPVSGHFEKKCGSCSLQMWFLFLANLSASLSLSLPTVHIRESHCWRWSWMAVEMHNRQKAQ